MPLRWREVSWRERAGLEQRVAIRLAENEKGGAVSKLPVLVDLLQAFVAIILGNLVYFWLMPSLPMAARHHRFHLDLGTVVDFWFCLVAYGLIRTARKWR